MTSSVSCFCVIRVSQMKENPNAKKDLDHNKAQVHDNISILMLKIRGDTVFKLSEIIFKEAFINGMFPQR